MIDLQARRCLRRKTLRRGPLSFVLVTGLSMVGLACSEPPSTKRCADDACKGDGRRPYAVTSGFERPADLRFLVRDGVGSEVEALQYYASIIPGFEPGRTRYTLRDWQEQHFGADLESCQGGQPEGRDLVDARFEGSSDDFSYRDDIFRGTNQPLYADGRGGRFSAVSVDGSSADSARFSATRRRDSGSVNGGLQVLLGGIDDRPIEGMSGGWTVSFDVPRREKYSLRLRYQLSISGRFEATETAQVFVLLDGKPYRDGAKDYIDSLTGNGQSVQRTGAQVFEEDIDLLEPGTHTLTVGLYLSAKSSADEVAQLLIDEVQLVENAFCRLADGRLVGSECCNLVQAFYLNNADLGFWREMVCTEQVDRNRGGCMVRNWRDEDDPQNGGRDLGTVAMTVSEEGFAQFYVFGPRGAQISAEATLDGEGPKFVPQICTVCHGGIYKDRNPDLGAVFREFLPSALAAREAALQQDAEDEWHELNQAVRTANLSLRTENRGAPQGFDDRVDRIVSYLDELYVTDFPPVPYGGGSIALVPESWRSASNPKLAQAKRDLWSRVVAPYCMGCHRINNNNFTNYHVFKGLAQEVDGKSLLQSYLQDNVNDPQRFAMPQAELLFNRLHRDSAALLVVDSWLGLANSGVADTSATSATDTENPVVQIKQSKQSSATEQLPGAVDVMVQAFDNNQVASIELTLDDKPLFKQDYTVATPLQLEFLSIRDVPAGTHQLGAVATDRAGNIATTNVSLTVEVGPTGERRNLLNGASLGGANGAGSTEDDSAYTDAGFSCGVVAVRGKQSLPGFMVWLLLCVAVVRRKRRQGGGHD